MGQATPGATPPITRSTTRHRKGSTWPFMAKGLGQSVTISDFGVGIPRRQEVEFADGSRLWLHRIDVQGVPDLFLRELGAPAAGLKIDLRKLVPELAEDLPIASTRDVPGTVHYALRGRFKSADALIEAAIAQGSPA